MFLDDIIKHSPKGSIQNFDDLEKTANSLVNEKPIKFIFGDKPVENFDLALESSSLPSEQAVILKVPVKWNLFLKE